MDHVQGEPDAVCDFAAVAVLAMVGVHSQELVDAVPVRVVYRVGDAPPPCHLRLAVEGGDGGVCLADCAGGGGFGDDQSCGGALGVVVISETGRCRRSE